MNRDVIDPFLVLALLNNFYVLGMSRLRLIIIAVAIQGAILGLLYPLAHAGVFTLSPLSLLRLLALTLAVISIKGWVIPRLLFQAVLLADMRSTVSSVIGFVPTLLLGGVATAAALIFATSLPLPNDHFSHLLIPASLATVMSGFILLATRREALAQVLGYIVLENGIFIFGLLLIEAVPVLVEFGIVLDLFVGVFVMGIIINHVSRAFPAASSEQGNTLLNCSLGKAPETTTPYRDNLAMVLPIIICMLLTLVLGVYNPPVLSESIDNAVKFLQRMPQ